MLKQTDVLEFDQAVSLATLCAYLSRAATCNNAINSACLEDDLRMVRDVGALFLGRAAYVWVPEADDDAHFAKAAEYVRRVHEIDPRIICQAAVFEAVYPAIETVAIPAWVFEELDEPVEQRSFRFGDCFGPEFRSLYHWDRWSPGCQVPDIRCPEARRWFYYRCRRYLDAGYEAIHLGQVHLYAGRDEGYRLFSDLVARVRAYAASHARRHVVLLDAHTHGVAVNGRLLLDLHSRPFSCRPDREHPERLILHLKGSSLGGVAPSGWPCPSLPYLIEVDNWGGYSLEPEHWHDLDRRASTGRWGWDDIAWFAHQDEADRNHFLEYAHKFMRLRDPMAFFQMPLRRLLGRACVTREGATGAREIWHYQANRPSPACPDGFGQEDTIRRVCREPLPEWLVDYHADVARPHADRDDSLPDFVSIVGDLQKPLGGTPGDSFCPHSRLFHRGRGVYELASVIPWPGSYNFTVAVGGTMTEVYREGNIAGGKPFVLRTVEANTLVRIHFEYAGRRLSATDASGAGLLNRDSA